MKTLALVTTVTALLTSAAFAETVVIKKEGIGGSTTVVREVEAPPTVVERREVPTTGTVGCDTTSVTKTNEVGDRTTKTKTEC